MVVQHNLTAMNSNRMLGVTTGAQQKSTEKLSSGFKINRAADDAAGLAISEKMRKQIRGLTQASANAEDGISAVQTAEGALNEVHDMLQRMNELAVKAANGTNSESDRTSIQNEIDQITTEIDRVSETTKFNETYLLKGDKAKARQDKFTYAANGGSNVPASVSQGSKATGVLEDKGTTLKATVAFSSGASQSAQNTLAKSLVSQGFQLQKFSTYNGTSTTSGYTLTLNGDAANNYDVVATSKSAFQIKDSLGNTVATVKAEGGNVAPATSTNTRVSVSSNLAGTSATAAVRSADTAAYYDKDGNKISANALNRYFVISGSTVTARADAPTVYDAVGKVTSLNAARIAGAKELVGNLKLTLHVGADATAENQININIDSMSAKSLGVNGLRVDGADDSNALGAIETIKEALQKVSDQRSALGAVQNRLEHTIKNLDNVVENTTAAESQIRDTDMASEMVKYSNNNILSQAGQSMLAQANQSNQGVLSLLG